MKQYIGTSKSDVVMDDKCFLPLFRWRSECGLRTLKEYIDASKSDVHGLQMLLLLDGDQHTFLVLLVIR
jgi:hypothetical protein